MLCIRIYTAAVHTAYSQNLERNNRQNPFNRDYAYQKSKKGFLTLTLNYSNYSRNLKFYKGIEDVKMDETTKGSAPQASEPSPSGGETPKSGSQQQFQSPFTGQPYQIKPEPPKKKKA